MYPSMHPYVNNSIIPSFTDPTMGNYVVAVESFSCILQVVFHDINLFSPETVPGTSTPSRAVAYSTVKPFTPSATQLTASSVTTTARG